MKATGHQTAQCLLLLQPKLRVLHTAGPESILRTTSHLPPALTRLPLLILLSGSFAILQPVLGSIQTFIRSGCRLLNQQVSVSETIIARHLCALLIGRRDGYVSLAQVKPQQTEGGVYGCVATYPEEHVPIQ